MRRTEADQGVRMIKFSSILSCYEAAEFSQAEAAELLGIGERTFRRWRQRFEDEGEAGLLDRRLGKASGKRVPSDRSDEVEALYRTRYAGFTARLRCHNGQSRIVSGMRASQASRASRPVAVNPFPPFPTLPSGLNRTVQYHRPSCGPPKTL